MEDDKFCTNCGATLSDEDTFCPNCGHSDDPSSESAKQSEIDRAVYLEKCRSRLIISMILCTIVCVVTLYFGTILAFEQDILIDTLKDSPEGWDQINKLISEQALRDVMSILGYVLIASGIFAAITVFLTAIKKCYPVAIITCILASILGLVVAVGLFGFIATYYIVKCKDAYN